MKGIRIRVFALTAALAVFSMAEPSNKVDVFGIAQLYPTKAGTLEWNSAHWGNGNSRGVSWDGDKDDPMGWTENHSAGSADPFFKIDGKGVMQMMSYGPRFHINSLKGGKQQFYRDVEFTAYYRRGEASTDGPDYGGMVMGVRSGALGHSSSGGNDCDASTYYARFRHDGKWDFEKEWKHPASYYQSMGVIGKQSPMWNGARLPTNRWIGMKFIVYNISEKSVKLELYADTVSNGVVKNAKWEKVGEALDEGKDWSGAGANVGTISGCKDYNGLENAYDAILEGHGTVLMRTDGKRNNEVQGEYMFVSVREIDPQAQNEPDVNPPEAEKPTEEDNPSNNEENPGKGEENIPPSENNPGESSTALQAYEKLNPAKNTRYLDLLGRPAHKDQKIRLVPVR